MRAEHQISLRVKCSILLPPPPQTLGHTTPPQLQNRVYASICQNVNDTLYTCYYEHHTFTYKVPPAADRACKSYGLGTESGEKEN
jgi:hypothetical protein